MSKRLAGLADAATLMTCVTLLVFAGINVVRGRTRSEAPFRPVSIDIDQSKTIGSDSAAVGLLVFSDFDCPFCKRFAETVLPVLIDRYVNPGVLTISFAHLPMPFHLRAMSIAKEAECAAQQGKFWPMHDALFKRPDGDQESPDGRAGRIGMSLGLFQTCTSSLGAEAQIHKDVAVATGADVKGTPTILIGRREPGGKLRATTRIIGARAPGEFGVAIEALLDSAKVPTRK